MSINSAMRAGVSGLVANSAALAAISDNIANVNTVGYKRNQSDFSTIVTAAASSGAYNAGGVISSNRQQVSKQGLLQQTTSSTDLGISGSGFFVTTEKAVGLTADDTRLFTRAGSFTVDSGGYLRNSGGLYLQGWPADSNGVITATPDLNALDSINVSTIGGVATPTTRANISGNLKADQPLSAAALAREAGTTGAYDETNPAFSMAGYDPVTGTGVKPDYSIQFPVGDSKGIKHTFQIDFLRNADPTAPNTWFAEIHVVPSTDIEGSTPGVPLQAGMVNFKPDGSFDNTNNAANLFADWADPTIQIGDSASGDPIAWADALGINGQTLRIDLGAAPGYFTQLATSSTQSVQTNGTAFGGLTNIEVDEQGFVTANFDNGNSRRIGQVAVATFANADGLLQVSGNAYRVSLGSGPYNLKTPGDGGAGFISPSTLEASTVDLSSEFTGLITTQRAYSASSKIITTADQMLEELLSIKR